MLRLETELVREDGDFPVPAFERELKCPVWGRWTRECSGCHGQLGITFVEHPAGKFRLLGRPLHKLPDGADPKAIKCLWWERSDTLFVLQQALRGLKRDGGA